MSPPSDEDFILVVLWICAGIAIVRVATTVLAGGEDNRPSAQPIVPATIGISTQFCWCSTRHAQTLYAPALLAENDAVLLRGEGSSPGASLGGPPPGYHYGV
jgi:hypothetical protein